MGFLILIVAVVAVGLPFCLLRHPFVGFGRALFGAIVVGGLTFAACLAYLKYGYTPPQYQNDTSFGGLADMIVLMVFFPGAGTIVGFVLGTGYAFWRERSLPATSSPNTPTDRRLDAQS